MTTPKHAELVERLRKYRHTCRGTSKDFTIDEQCYICLAANLIEQQALEIEALKKDAERYRWMIEPNRWYISVLSDLMDRIPKICCIGQDLSAAIDAARAAKGE